MELSNAIKKKAAALGVKPEYMVMADLMAIGYNERDAFMLAYPSKAVSITEEALATQIRNVTLSDRFKKLKAATRERLKESFKVKATSDDIDLISGEDVAREILKSALHQPVGSKERAELFIKYQELMRKNDVSDDVTEDTIQFYLPLCCDKCPLMIAHRQKNH